MNNLTFVNIILVLFSGLGAIFVGHFVKRWLDGPKTAANHTHNYYYSNNTKPAPQPTKLKQVSENIAVSSVKNNQVKSFDLTDFIESTKSIEVESSNNQSYSIKPESISLPKDVSKPFSLGSLGQTNFKFDPYYTTVTALGDGAGMVSDNEKIFISKPKEQVKIGIYNPLGLDTLIIETDEEIIIRMKKDKQRDTSFNYNLSNQGTNWKIG